MYYCCSTDFTVSHVVILSFVQVELAKEATDSFNAMKKDPLPAGTNLHKYLVAYVNQELFLDPPIPSRGKALFDTCSDPTSLWLVV